MAKIITNPGSIIPNQPGGEHITRIAYDNNEPPKNYIWCKPNGDYYRYDGSKWIPCDVVVSNFQTPNVNVSEIVLKSDLDSRIKTLKTEMIRQLKKMVQLINCSEESSIDGSNYLTCEEVSDISSLQL